MPKSYRNPSRMSSEHSSLDSGQVASKTTNLGADGAWFEQALISEIPHLRAFARSFTNQPQNADDLVQETMLKAWQSRSSFAAGTNFRGWLFTILRNTYLSDYRKRKRMVADSGDGYASTLAIPPDQLANLYLADVSAALAQLPDDQREALLLVGAEDFSYEEAAKICGCAVGTIKSRVNRARGRLGVLLDVKSAREFSAETLQPIPPHRTKTD